MNSLHTIQQLYQPIVVVSKVVEKVLLGTSFDILAVVDSVENVSIKGFSMVLL